MTDTIIDLQGVKQDGQTEDIAAEPAFGKAIGGCTHACLTSDRQLTDS